MLAHVASAPLYFKIILKLAQIEVSLTVFAAMTLTLSPCFTLLPFHFTLLIPVIILFHSPLFSFPYPSLKFFLFPSSHFPSPSFLLNLSCNLIFPSAAFPFSSILFPLFCSLPFILSTFPSSHLFSFLCCFLPHFSSLIFFSSPRPVFPSFVFLPSPFLIFLPLLFLSTLIFCIFLLSPPPSLPYCCLPSFCLTWISL